MHKVHEVLTPEQIAARAGGAAPRLHMPERSSVFGERARRLRQLAPGHSMHLSLMRAMRPPRRTPPEDALWRAMGASR